MSGPFFEDLVPGWTHSSMPMAVTDGHAAWYLALSGDINPIHLDLRGAPAPLNTALIAQIAIGQSTVATREVVANLYYRDVVFHRPVAPGVRLSTTTTVAARSETAGESAAPRGKVLLRMETTDGDGRPVATIVRCALVRKREEARIDEVRDLDADSGSRLAWASAMRAWLPVLEQFDLPPQGWRALPDPDTLAEPVTDALQLVRATGNLARAHRDAAYGQGGRRLVYGGHTLALAQASFSRTVGAAHVVLGWERCSHPAPVFEGDVLVSATGDPVESAPGLTRFHVTTSKRTDDAPERVQDWSPLIATRG